MALLLILISARISTNSSYGKFKEIKIFISHGFLFLLDKYHLIVPILFWKSWYFFRYEKVQLNIVLIGITNEIPEHDEKYEMHRLIGTLLSGELKEQEKLDIIEHEYNIPISQEFREDVSIMCNLSQGIEDKAIAKIVMNMYKIGYTPNQIADAVGVSVDEVEAIIKKKEPAMA